MFTLTELTLPPLPPPLRAELGLAAAPLLRRVELAMLRPLLDSNRLVPEGILTPAEQAVLAGLTFPKRRLEWLGGRLAAKAAALAWEGRELSDRALADWQVSSAPDGRPGLERLGARGGEAVPELSISHSHGLAAALVTDRPCGLDLQLVTETVLRVRERFCTPEDSGFLRCGGLAAVREEVCLTLLWTAKEALRKGRGGEPLTGFLAMRLAGVERLAEQGWCFRLAVAGAREYPVVAFLFDDFAGAVSVVRAAPSKIIRTLLGEKIWNC